MSLVALADVHKVYHRGSRPPVFAVNGVSFEIERGEAYALIGESGSGKSTVGRLALGLTSVTTGDVCFDGINLGALRAPELRSLRRRMQLVFQEPFESLNPRLTIEATLEEPLRIHDRLLTRRERHARVVETLESVGLDESVCHRYPHQLSGGQQKRVGIGRALIVRPEFIVLDEPTSSLDLSMRAEVLGLLKELQSEFDLAYLLISHDMSTVDYFADRVGVMYLGEIIETGTTEKVLAAPLHPYTRALISAGLSIVPEDAPPVYALTGEPRSPTQLPQGCVLCGRCPIESSECREVPVRLARHEPGHSVACIKA